MPSCAVLYSSARSSSLTDQLATQRERFEQALGVTPDDHWRDREGLLTRLRHGMDTKEELDANQLMGQLGMLDMDECRGISGEENCSRFPARWAVT